LISPEHIVCRPFNSTADKLPKEIHPVLRRILLARGLTSESDIDLALTGLLAPAGLGDVDRGARRLARAVRDGEKILVVGDFDADGATGSAVAIRALRAMGAESVGFRVPNRFEFGYGLTVPLVDTLSDDPPDLIVTVDSGVSSIAGVERAAEIGCEVIVTDHHLPGEELPPATAIVNPNLEGDAFPSKALAGVGVVFYLLSVVRKELEAQGWFGPKRPLPQMSQWLDLVALGTVADLVPLDRNNRILVRNGVERIRRGLACPGLMALMRVADRDYRYARAADLGFAVGPRLNAAGRLEDMSVGIRCLITDDPNEAMGLAGQLDSLNRQRRELQEDMQRQAFESVKALLEGLQGDALPAALTLHDESWHQGVVGLVASRIKDAIHRPVAAFAPEAAGSSLLKGSARSIRGLHIRDALAVVDARNPGLINAYGGHAMAAGLTLEEGRLRKFSNAFEAAVTEQLNGAEPVNEVRTDGELDPTDIGTDLALTLERSGPWGQRYPEPLFDGQFEVTEQRIVGQKHLKMKLRPIDGRESINAIAFNHLPEDLERASGPSGSSCIRMLYRLNVNRWQGSESCQLLVEHFVSG
jgi:single-stranded-DNA-specific exonuclease